MSVKVSVVIPVYNPGEYLIPCLESVTDQTVFDSMEILLVDDGSTDGSAQVCDSYSEKYGNIRVFHQENSGVSVARNKGLKEAVGEFVGFVDADDLIEPSMYEKLYAAAKETGADIAVCSIRQPYPDREVIIEYPFCTDVLLGKEKIRTEVAPFLIRDEALNSLCNKIFLREKIKDLRLTVGKKYGEDREFFIKALTVSDGMCSIPYVGYYYRYVETGAIQKPRSDYGKRMLQQYESDVELFSKLGIDKETFDDIGAECLSSRIVGAISFANNKFSGKQRKEALLGVVNDEELRKLLDSVWDKVEERQSKFSLLVLRAMRNRSIAGIKAVMLLMKIKVAAVNLIGGNR